ncbi:hypothetical protein ACLOJK_001225 [Asimina triloba]
MCWPSICVGRPSAPLLWCWSGPLSFEWASLMRSLTATLHAKTKGGLGGKWAARPAYIAPIPASNAQENPEPHEILVRATDQNWPRGTLSCLLPLSSLASRSHLARTLISRSGAAAAAAAAGRAFSHVQHHVALLPAFSAHSPFHSFLSLRILAPKVDFYNTAYRIDCGGPDNFTSEFNQSWIADRFYTGGAPGIVAGPHEFPLPQERTLRFFPISFGKKNCYLVDVPNGRYYIRTFTVYDNYDSKLHSPSFDVSVEGTVVFSWRSPWEEEISRTGAYSDVFAYINDGEAAVCFYSIATDAPVIGSLEIVQVDPLSYDSFTTGRDMILVNYGRLTCGSSSFGSGFSNDTDLFGRAWQSDARFRNTNVKVKPLSTTKHIWGTNQSPNYFPTHLYQTAITVSGGGNLEYELPVDTRLDYLLWFHFAEIDSSVTAAGKRVFDVYINQKNVNRIDIYREVRSFAAFKWHYTVTNLNTTPLSVKLVPIVGPPLISGLENYAMVPLDLSTVSNQVTAMRALKESLRVPDRMGWNGDPCAPSTWDAWEGVTCHRNVKGDGLVITQL